MSVDAVIFDLDGTLVDTNLWHAQCWQKTFAEAGYALPQEVVAIQVGKGGDQLVPALLGQTIYEEMGEELGKICVQKFEELAGTTRIQIFTNAVELVCACRQRGLRTALATSGEKAALDAIEKSSGVAWQELFDAVVTGADIEKSKPAPEVLLVAAEKLGLSPLQCALVGDTPYDALSARTAGMAFLGVATGGHAPEVLVESGARGVWKDTQDLLNDLDDALHRASPGTLKLTNAVQQQLMEVALKGAREGMNSGEVPIGCALFDGKGRLLARSFNAMNATKNKTAHAEIVAFTDAARKVALDDATLILVSTLEPCVMCTGAAMEAGVDVVIYGLRAPADAGTARVDAPRSPESQMPRILGGVLAAESRQLFEEWLADNGDTQQADYVKQLLMATR